MKKTIQANFMVSSDIADRDPHMMKMRLDDAKTQVFIRLMDKIDEDKPTIVVLRRETHPVCGSMLPPDSIPFTEHRLTIEYEEIDPPAPHATEFHQHQFKLSLSRSILSFFGIKV
jgi:hypothetical protein